MSRSKYKVIRIGICTGSNTQYYRSKRRRFRRVAKQNLRIELDNYVNPEDLKKFKDSWDEPTDGSRLYYLKDLLKYSHRPSFRKYIYRIRK